MRKYTILVVDDDPTFVLYATELLSLHGFTVVSAGNGEEGVSRAEELRPDLILMDLNMPKMNGFEAAGRLSRSTRTERIPIIALTALDSPADCESAFIAGCDDHIPKPIKGEDLLAKISSILHLP